MLWMYWLILTGKSAVKSIIETLSTQYPVIVTDCVRVTGVDNHPEGNGLYHYNASLEECYGTKSGHPTYKHESEEVYLWYYQFSRFWYSSTTNCDYALPALLFRVYQTAAYSPDLVTPGSWRMTNTARTGDTPHAALTVTTMCRKIFTFNVTLVSCYSSLQKKAYSHKYHNDMSTPHHRMW